MALRLILLAVNVAVLMVVLVLYRRVRKTESTRTVEAPNSAHRSVYLEDVEAKERWRNLDLDRMHPVNREEVERTLEKLRATSIRALTDAERAFLDRMVEAERRSIRGGLERPPKWTPVGRDVASPRPHRV